MTRILGSLVLVACLSLGCGAQVDHIVIAAGTPEDHTLQEISKESDPQKRLALYQDFVQKFSTNPAAVAYGNWQISQSYQTAGDLAKALAYGDQALAASPHNIEILVSQVGIAQQLKDNAKIMDYAEKGGQAYQGIDKQPKPEGMSDQEFATRVAGDKDAVKGAMDSLEAGGFNAIVEEKDAKTRMSYIERFSAAFPNSKFKEQVSEYAMYTLGPGQLNDSARLVTFGEKTLAADPNSIPTLLLLSSAYVEDSKPASVAKAITYSQKVIQLAKANEADADRSRKLSVGMAHFYIGYAYLKQDKTAAAIPELKSAAELLKGQGQDNVAYATALYRLGYAYAKLNRVADARSVLNEAVQIPGPVQQPSRDLLAKIESVKPKAK